MAGEEKALSCRNIGRGEAESVLARIGGRECEFAGTTAALRDNTMIIVEDFVDGYEQAL
jgi:hypothetical protein